MTGFHVLEESADEILEDVAHTDGIEGLRTQVQLREGFHHGIQTAVFIHLVDVGGHLKLFQNVNHVAGKAGEVGLEIICYVVRVIAEFSQGEAAGIVEVVSTQSVHGFFRISRNGLELLHNCLLGRFEGTFKAADDGHRDNDIAVLVRHIRAS